METAITARPMVYKEARECADRINKNMNDVRHLVYDLYTRDGWTALGYQSWRECVTAEFKQSQSYLYYQLEAAQIERNISTIVEKEPIPEGQLRPLSKLEPAQQREAWRRAVATAPDGKVTAAHVYKIVKGMRNQESPPKPKVNQPIIKQEPISPEFQRAFDQMDIEIKNARAMKWETTSHKGAIELMQILLTIAEQ